MLTPLTLPSCYSAALESLFPTLNFDRIDWYLGEASDFNTDHPNAETRPELTRTVIVVRRELWNSLIDQPGLDLFRTLCHECVHAVQIRSMSVLWQRVTSSTCKLLKPYADQCLEREALDYEATFAHIVQDDPAAPKPCLSIGASIAALGGSTLTIANPAFAAFVADHPDLIKRMAGCSAWDCVGSGIFGRLGGAVLIAGGLLVNAVGIFATEGRTGVIGTVAGAIAGAIVGVASGNMLGVAAGGMLGAAVGAIVGGLFGGLVGAILHWASGLFGSAGQLNLLFSTDGGQSFGSKVTFESSREPMALAFRDDRLAIAWTGTDSRLNLVFAPQNTKLAFELSQSCGPAIVWNGKRLHYFWQGRDNQMNVITTHDGVNLEYVLRRVMPTESPDDASPAAVQGFDATGDMFLSYVGTDNKINLLRSPSGVDFGAKLVLDEFTGSDGTAALAWNGTALFVAWAGTDGDHSLNIMNVSVTPGTMTPGVKHVLPERCASSTGPAIACVGHVLCVAWIGSDGQVNFATSVDGGASLQNKHAMEKSRDDCGPALTVHQDGTICLGWIGTA